MTLNRRHDASVGQTPTETGEVAGFGGKAAYGEEERLVRHDIRSESDCCASYISLHINYTYIPETDFNGRMPLAFLSVLPDQARYLLQLERTSSQGPASAAS